MLVDELVFPQGRAICTVLAPGKRHKPAPALRVAQADKSKQGRTEVYLLLDTGLFALSLGLPPGEYHDPPLHIRHDRKAMQSLYVQCLATGLRFPRTCLPVPAGRRGAGRVPHPD